MSKKDLTGKRYERMAGEALKVLFGVGRNCSGTVRRNRVLTGASGASHEIDIVMEIDRDTGKSFVAAECKDHVRPVEKETVAAFFSVLQDVNAVREEKEKLHGVMVSSGGFQSGAVEFGAYAGIILLTVRCPDEREWVRFVKALLRENRQQNPGKRGVKDLTVDVRTNERILIVPDQSGEKEYRKWKLDSSLGRDAYSLVYTDRNSRESLLLPELLRRMPAEGQGIHCRVVLKGSGSKLHHLVWDEDMPVKRIEYVYDDLSRDAEDTIMFGRERPDLLVSEPVHHWWGGIWKGKFDLLTDPVRETREYDGNVKIHTL